MFGLGNNLRSCGGKINAFCSRWDKHYCSWSVACVLAFLQTLGLDTVIKMNNAFAKKKDAEQNKKLIRHHLKIKYCS